MQEDWNLQVHRLRKLLLFNKDLERSICAYLNLYRLQRKNEKIASSLISSCALDGTLDHLLQHGDESDALSTMICFAQKKEGG